MSIINIFDSIKVGQLIGKYLTGKESKDELDQLKTWINESNDHQELFNSLRDEKNIADSIDEFETFNKELAWKRYMERVSVLSLQKMLLRWKVAAIFFFVVGCGGILAYLIKDGNGPSAINETYTTVSTTNGQNSKVVLPDSSVVWINSGTTLSYNTNFAVTDRKIKLKGQAFFQIARNEQMPLVVSCNEINVRVLGTRFDVSAYPEDKNINVVLESGSVEILQAKNQSVIQKLKPGEKAEFDAERHDLSVSEVDCHDYTSWKDGILVFVNEPMENVLKKLKRWYNIDIEVKNPKVSKLIFNATIVNESVEDIFDLMRFSCSISYTIIPSRNPEIPVKVIIY